MIPFMTSSRCSMNCNAPREKQFSAVLPQLPLAVGDYLKSDKLNALPCSVSPAMCLTVSQAAQAPFSHFFMKLVFAAPESGLPSWLTALVAQVSAMHFFMNEVLAAPASGLPSLPTALLSQVSCARAAPPANITTNAANIIFLSMVLSHGSHY